MADRFNKKLVSSIAQVEEDSIEWKLWPDDMG